MANIPEWQQKLNNYATDKNSAMQEVLRAKQVYENEAKAYGSGFASTDRAKQISTWADQVRSAGGLDDSAFGKNVSLKDASSIYSVIGGNVGSANQVAPQTRPSGYDFDKDAYYDMLLGGTKSQLDGAYNSKLQAINNALTRALTGAENAKTGVNNEYVNRKADIEQNAYQDIERSKVVGANRGVMSSLQQMAMEGDVLSRENKNHASSAQLRDSLLSEIRNRIGELNATADQDRLTAKSNYQSDLARAEFEARLRAEEMAMNRADRAENREWQLEDRQAGYDRSDYEYDRSRQDFLTDRQDNWNREDTLKVDDREWQKEFYAYQQRISYEYNKKLQAGLQQGRYSNTDGQYYNVTKGYVESVISGKDENGNDLSPAQQLEKLTKFKNDMNKDPLYNQNTHPEIRDMNEQMLIDSMDAIRRRILQNQDRTYLEMLNQQGKPSGSSNNNTSSYSGIIPEDSIFRKSLLDAIKGKSLDEVLKTPIYKW